jgi:hypothetical protein
MAVVVVPESSSTDWPSSTKRTAAWAICDLCFAVELLFLAQRRIEQGAGLHGQRAAMSTLDDPLAVEELQIFADRDLRNTEMAGEIFDEHASIAVQDPEDFTAAFFVEQTVRRHEFRFVSNSNFR